MKVSHFLSLSLVSSAPTLDKNQLLTKDFKNQQDSNQRILLTYPWAAPDSTEILKTRQLGPECGSCIVTNNHLFDKSADAVFFQTTSLFTRSAKQTAPDPQKRSKDQIWIGFFKESFAKGSNKAAQIVKNQGQHCCGWDSAFNLTAGYRRDDDIRIPFLGNAYATFQKVQKELELGITGESILAAKRSDYIAFSAISNCDNIQHAKRRNSVIKELVKAGLKLTGMGACYGDDKVPGVNYVVETKEQRKSATFRRDIIKEHKFYLAFENGLHCRDYISEKFWRNSLEYHAVPVVFGPWKDDLVKTAPKNSFIFLEDYESPEALVEHLNYLNNNDTAYLEYHAWRNDAFKAFEGGDEFEYVDNSRYSDSFCESCLKINEMKKTGEEKVIKSYTHKLWADHPDDFCVENHPIPKDLYHPSVFTEKSPLFTYSNGNKSKMWYHKI